MCIYISDLDLDAPASYLDTLIAKRQAAIHATSCVTELPEKQPPVPFIHCTACGTGLKYLLFILNNSSSHHLLLPHRLLAWFLQGPRISEEEAEMAASMHESDTGATEAVQASAGTPLESVLSIPPPATGEPPETPRQGEMFVRGAVELGSPSAATSAQGELRNELLDKGLAPFQARNPCNNLLL